MKKVWIEPGCTSCGLCEFVAPDIFEINNVSSIKKDAPVATQTENIKLAAFGCPVSVIKFEE